MTIPVMGIRRQRIAVLEANRFHEEVLFAFVAAAARLPCGADITVFAPNHWHATEFTHDDLRLECDWLPFDAFLPRRLAASPFDLIVANTFPSSDGEAAIDEALDSGQPVFGLVHDIAFFNDPDGAQAALERWPKLIVGHAGIRPPRPVSEFPARPRERIARFVPVLPAGGNEANYHTRTGVALPGALEFARRDISTALRLTARSGLPLRIFGRSKDHGDGPKVQRDLDAERRRLYAEIDRVGASTVVITVDLSCHDFYHTVERSRFVAVLPASPDYLHGKLTGAVTAALSCGVPMLALPEVHEHYTGTDPAPFRACMLRFDPAAAEGHHDEWGTLVRDTAPDVYDDLCRAAEKARERMLNENTDTLSAAIANLSGAR